MIGNVEELVSIIFSGIVIQSLSSSQFWNGFVSTVDDGIYCSQFPSQFICSVVA